MRKEREDLRFVAFLAFLYSYLYLFVSFPSNFNFFLSHQHYLSVPTHLAHSKRTFQLVIWRPITLLAGCKAQESYVHIHCTY